MKTEREIREYLADCKEAVKEFDKMQDSLQACKYEGIVEGLEFVLTNNSLVTNKEQSKLNKIAEWFMNQRYHKSLNGTYAHSEAHHTEYDEITESDTIVFFVRYGRQDDCFNDRYSKTFKVDRDKLNKWDGIGLPDIKELSSHSVEIS